MKLLRMFINKNITFKRYAYIPLKQSHSVAYKGVAYVCITHTKYIEEIYFGRISYVVMSDWVKRDTVIPVPIQSYIDCIA